MSPHDSNEAVALEALLPAIDRVIYNRVMSRMSTQNVDDMVATAMSQRVVASVNRALETLASTNSLDRTTFDAHVAASVQTYLSARIPGGFEAFVAKLTDELVSPKSQKAVIKKLMDRIDGSSHSTFFYRLEQAVWGAVEDRFVKLIETNSELMSKRFLEKLQNMVKEHGDVQR